MTSTAPRRAALAALRAVRGGALADRALAEVLPALEPRERAWVYELVMGVLRLRGRLDQRLERHVRGGTGRLQPDVLDALRLGAYQLESMRSVPAYAAISQSVELARWAGAGRAAGLVNGVLRALDRANGEGDGPGGEGDGPGGDGDGPGGDGADEPAARLSGHGSHPRWLVERWLERWGAARTAAIVEADNRRPELYCRPVGVERDRALVLLERAGVEALPVADAPDSIRLGADASLEAALDAAPLIVQDPAAALVVRYAAAPAGALALDLCAAPGGKSVGLLDRAAGVVAADVSMRRMDRLAETRSRLELERLRLVAADARRPPFAPATADLVLLDVPCTGTGTLRRHPDAKWRLRPEDLAALTALQREILLAAAPLVRSGGVLVYATCSLEPEENQEQVERFLSAHDDFALERAPDGVDERFVDASGALSVTPDVAGFDGAYAARLVRRD